MMDDTNTNAEDEPHNTVTVEVKPDLRKLRSFMLDLTALIDKYWPESAQVSEADGSARSPEELSYTNGSPNGIYTVTNRETKTDTTTAD